MLNKHLTSGQIRAARAFLRWRAEDLARASAVGVATIRRAELEERETSMTAPTTRPSVERLRLRASSSSTRTAADRGSGCESGNRKRASPTLLSRCRMPARFILTKRTQCSAGGPDGRIAFWQNEPNPIFLASGRLARASLMPPRYAQSSLQLVGDNAARILAAKRVSREIASGRLHSFRFARH